MKKPANGMEHVGRWWPEEGGVLGSWGGRNAVGRAVAKCSWRGW